MKLQELFGYERQSLYMFRKKVARKVMDYLIKKIKAYRMALRRNEIHHSYELEVGA